jgi:hypothetical protein
MSKASPAPSGNTRLGTAARWAAALLLGAGLAASPLVSASAAPRASAKATAKVISPLRIQRTHNLAFGAVKGGKSSGKVIVPAKGSVQYQGGVKKEDCDCHDDDLCGVQAARFTVSGLANREYQINLPASVTVSGQKLDRRDRTPLTLTVTNFTAYSQTRGATGTVGRLNASGKDTLYVGGQLNVPANAPPGAYILQVQVTVSYN